MGKVKVKKKEPQERDITVIKNMEAMFSILSEDEKKRFFEEVDWEGRIRFKEDHNKIVNCDILQEYILSGTKWKKYDLSKYGVQYIAYVACVPDYQIELLTPYISREEGKQYHTNHKVFKGRCTTIEGERYLSTNTITVLFSKDTSQSQHRIKWYPGSIKIRHTTDMTEDQKKKSLPYTPKTVSMHLGDIANIEKGLTDTKSDHIYESLVDRAEEVFTCVPNKYLGPIGTCDEMTSYMEMKGLAGELYTVVRIHETSEYNGDKVEYKQYRGGSAIYITGESGIKVNAEKEVDSKAEGVFNAAGKFSENSKVKKEKGNRKRKPGPSIQTAPELVSNLITLFRNKALENPDGIHSHYVDRLDKGIDNHTNILSLEFYDNDLEYTYIHDIYKGLFERKIYRTRVHEISNDICNVHGYSRPICCMILYKLKVVKKDLSIVNVDNIGRLWTSFGLSCTNKTIRYHIMPKKVEFGLYKHTLVYGVSKLHKVQKSRKLFS